MIHEFYNIISEFIPFLSVMVVVVLSLIAANRFLLHRKSDIGEEAQFTKRILMVVLSCTGIVIVILALPIESSTQGHLLSLLGVLLSAVIALSSTTFVSNAMAGFMLRAVYSFRPGDFICVNDQYGRVTERGLIHTEIQTEDRDLVTIPNLCLITNPVKVTRSSGTIVSATVSLGYDVPNDIIEKLLVKSALAAELDEPFMQILELGDFSVTYRIAGFLSEVKQVLTARSQLRKTMLNTLHNANIEIVSPSFMNQRPINPDVPVIPHKKGPIKTSGKEDLVPEELIFDKAEEAEKVEQLKNDYESIEKEIRNLESDLKRSDGAPTTFIKNQIRFKKDELETVKQQIESPEDLKKK